MKVSMNGIRTKLARNYKSLVNVYRTMKEGNESCDELGILLEDTRELVGTLLCCYDPGDDDFKELDIELPLVNPDDEDYDDD